MKSFVVDTNCIISFLTDRNPRQQVLIEPYFQYCADGEAEFVILENVKSELVYVLDSFYKVPKVAINQVLRDLFDSPGVSYAAINEATAELALWPERVSDHTDAVLAAYAMSRRLTVLTFDRKFAGQLRKMSIKYLHLQ